jgi:hypothetical protein
VRRDLVEHVQRLERQGLGPAEAAGRQDLRRPLERARELQPGREVPVERRAPHPGRLRDVGHGRPRIPRQQLGGGIEDPPPAPHRVGPHGAARFAFLGHGSKH